MDRTSRATARAGSPPFDSAIFDEMRDMLGGARLDQLLGLLAAELDQRPRALRLALADRDFAAAAAEARSLMGAAANLGAACVSDAARLVEQAIAAAASGDPRQLAPALASLAADLRAAQQALVDLRHTTITALRA